MTNGYVLKPKWSLDLCTDWDGTGSVSSCFSLILSNLASWTDKSSHLAHEINAQGLLVIHIRHLLKLQLKEDELDSAVSLMNHVQLQ